MEAIVRAFVGEKPRARMRAHRFEFPLLRSWQKPRFLPAETKLMSDKRAGARLVDRRSTRWVPSRDGQAHKRAGARLVDRRSARWVPSRGETHCVERVARAQRMR